MTNRRGPLDAIAITVAAMYFGIASAAAPQTLDVAALDEALRIARSRRPADIDNFSAPYVAVRGGPGQPSVEVITEFRRAVLLAKRQVDQGNHTWSPRNLSEAVAKYAGLTTVHAEIWLSPLHMFVTTPSYRLDLFTAAHRVVASVDEKREGIYSSLTSAEQPTLAGVTLESSYRAEALKEPGCCLVLIVDPQGETVVKQQVGFAGLR